MWDPYVDVVFVAGTTLSSVRTAQLAWLPLQLQALATGQGNFDHQRRCARYNSQAIKGPKNEIMAKDRHKEHDKLSTATGLNWLQSAEGMLPAQ